MTFIWIVQANLDKIILQSYDAFDKISRIQTQVKPSFKIKLTADEKDMAS